MESTAKDGPHTQRLLVRSGDIFDRGPDWQRERLVWAAWLLSLARALDRRQAGGEVGYRPVSTEVLSFAYEAFLVLADAEWWRAHPPRELSELEERRLGELRDHQERMLDRLPGGGWTLVTEALHDAVEAFFRAGYKPGLGDASGCWI